MKRTLVRLSAGIVVIAIVFVLGAFIFVEISWDTPSTRRVPDMQAPSDPATLARGEFLYKHGQNCWSCHSTRHDPASSPSGGRAFDLRDVGPGFGMFYTPNITPDSATGIGAWTDGEIVRAMREGVARGGRKLFPLMPVMVLHGISDDDALAIVAYLRSLPPVMNSVPGHELTFATRALFAFGLLKPEPEITAPVVAPPRGLTVEYGRYLSRNAALCYDCHSPRSLTDGTFYPDSTFAGSSIGFGADEGLPVNVYAPNLTMDRETGIGAWSEEEFVQAVRLGIRPDGRTLLPMMPYSSYAFWDTTDLKAVYRYLQTLDPVRRGVPPVGFAEAVRSGDAGSRGRALFSVACQQCHGEAGKGTSYTSLKLAEVAPSLSDEELLLFIQGGNPGLRMPPFGSTYSEQQLRDIIAYIRTFPLPGS